MRLRRANPADAGLRRRRRGKGWQYLDGDGNPIKDPEVCGRLNGLVIPPAWKDVWICPYPNGHLQAVGTDDAGRKQYLYHEQWRKERDEEKFNRVLDLVPLLPDFRSAVDDDLRTRGLTRARVTAGALRMLDGGVFRTGGDEYAEENGSRGAATLLRQDVVIERGDLVFHYPAKGGIDRHLRMRDQELARLVRSLRRARADDERLLVYRSGKDWCEVRAGDLNERFKELTGPDYTAKDLRTWNATVVAAVAFASTDRPGSRTGRKKVEVQVMDEVAFQLGNTRSVARSSYVDPRVVESFEEGHTIRDALEKAEAREEIEEAVHTLLTR
jgi:DNA topoisomerase I